MVPRTYLGEGHFGVEVGADAEVLHLADVARVGSHALAFPAGRGLSTVGRKRVYARRQAGTACMGMYGASFSALHGVCTILGPAQPAACSTRHTSPAQLTHTGHHLPVINLSAGIRVHLSSGHLVTPLLAVPISKLPTRRPMLCAGGRCACSSCAAVQRMHAAASPMSFCMDLSLRCGQRGTSNLRQYFLSTVTPTPSCTAAELMGRWKSCSHRSGQGIGIGSDRGRSAQLSKAKAVPLRGTCAQHLGASQQARPAH